MQTTYYWKAQHEPCENVQYVSISRKTPDYCDIPTYPDLFPSWDIILNDCSFAEYQEAYMQQLSKLDPQKVYDDLKDKTIVCYESAKDLASGKKYCHRRIVANWLQNELGVIIPEELRDKEQGLDVDAVWFPCDYEKDL